MISKAGHAFKVVFCGNTGVGKTSIIQRYCFGRFDKQARLTMGADFVASGTVVGGEEVKMHIWDTAGQEQYHAIGMLYFRGAAASFVVYDVSSENPLPQVQEWIDKLRSVERQTVIIVLGNKTDIVDTVDDTVASWCRGAGYEHFFCSARTGNGIKKAFVHTAQVLKDNLEKNPPTPAVIKEVEAENSRCC